MKTREKTVVLISIEPENRPDALLNHLPQQLINCRSVKTFQRALQFWAKEAAKSLALSCASAAACAKRSTVYAWLGMSVQVSCD